MGYAVAAAALSRGHDVTLLSGPVCLPPPAGARVEAFGTVDDLYEKASALVDDADCLVMAAAVGDYSPAARLPGKHKKSASLTLKLVPTRDVLSSLAPNKGPRIFVAFAVEVENALENAVEKARKKSADLLVLNSPASFGADEADFTFVFPSGPHRRLGRLPKDRLAGLILDKLESLFPRSSKP